MSYLRNLCLLQSHENMLFSSEALFYLSVIYLIKIFVYGMIYESSKNLKSSQKKRLYLQKSDHITYQHKL